MSTQDITCPRELSTLWAKSRKKQIRFEILNNLNCPTTLIYKALSIYNPQEVLSVPAVSFRTLWSSGDLAEFIEDTVFNVKESFIYYSSTFQNNLAFYLRALHSSGYSQAKSLSLISNKIYIKKFLVLRPNFLQELLESENLSNCSLGLIFNLYSKDLISDKELLAKANSARPFDYERTFLDSSTLKAIFVRLSTSSLNDKELLKVLVSLYTNLAQGYYGENGTDKSFIGTINIKRKVLNNCLVVLPSIYEPLVTKLS
jgi:hypothetical protein